jgi:transcriptional regulator with XRE-family HTH domain
MTSVALLRTLGELIRAARSETKLTQGELGARAGIGGKYVSEIERGTRDVPLSTLYSIVERGLQLQLDISFRKRSERALPARVEELALAIAAMPVETQTRVIALIRDLLELVA